MRCSAASRGYPRRSRRPCLACGRAIHLRSSNHITGSIEYAARAYATYYFTGHTRPNTARIAYPPIYPLAHAAPGPTQLAS